MTLSIQGEWERFHEITESVNVDRTERRLKAGALGCGPHEEPVKKTENELPSWDEKNQENESQKSHDESVQKRVINTFRCCWR